MKATVLYARAKECSEWQELQILCAEITRLFDAMQIQSPLTQPVATKLLDQLNTIVLALHDPFPAPLLSQFRAEISQLHELLTDIIDNTEREVRSDTAAQALGHLDTARLYWGRFESYCANRIDQLSNFTP